MKPVLSLTLPFLIFAFITNLSLVFSNDEPVLDTNGNPVIAGGEYYIFPATENTGKGGLRLVKTDDSKCLVTVLQNVNVTGLPVKFTIPNISNGKFFSEVTMFEIEFTKKPNCAKSSKWLIIFDFGLRIFNVIIGVQDAYIPEIIDGKFYFRKYYGNAYTLGFCNDLEEQTCLDIMRWNSSKDGGSRLSLIFKNQEVKEPYPVVFVDAPSFESGILMDVRL